MSALEQGENILIQCDGPNLKTVTDHILRTGEREREGPILTLRQRREREREEGRELFRIIPNFSSEVNLKLEIQPANNFLFLATWRRHPQLWAVSWPGCLWWSLSWTVREVSRNFSSHLRYWELLLVENGFTQLSVHGKYNLKGHQRVIRSRSQTTFWYPSWHVKIFRS